MTTQTDAARYYLNLFFQKAAYVYGFNAPTVINPVTIDYTYECFHTDVYDRGYYETKLVLYPNKIGSDNRGIHYGLSEVMLISPQECFLRCTLTGNLLNLPKNKVVLLFDGTEEYKTKTGAYIPGVGAFYMKDEEENAVIESIEKSGFKYWGCPDYIDYESAEFNPYADLKMQVMWLQAELNKKYKYSQILDVDGIFGDNTYAEVSKIFYRLYEGDEKNLVSIVQSILNTKYTENRLEVDGVFGSETKERVQRFQEDSDILPNGVVDRTTWKAIQNYILQEEEENVEQ